MKFNKIFASKSILLFSIFFQSITINAQQQYSPKQLKNDLEVIKEIVLGISPKLTPEDYQRINQLVEKNSKELENKTLDPIEFFNFLSEIDFQTKFDEHAALSLTEEVISPYLSTNNLFPVPIKIVGGLMVVNIKNSELPFGSIIKSINQVSIDSLLYSFTAEYKDSFIQRRLEAQFPFVYLVKKGGHKQFEISFSTPLDPESIITKSIEAIDIATYQKNYQNQVFPLNKDASNRLISTHYFNENKTYYFRLNSFNWNEDSQKKLLNFLTTDYKNFDKSFKAIFDEIANLKAEHLIIDLRQNMGGNVKIPGLLFKYIALQNFQENIHITIPDFDIPHHQYIKRISDEQVDNVKQVEDFIKKYNKQFKEKESGYEWTLVENEINKPVKDSFKGQVYLLVGGKSISAASYFAALFKSEKRGQIIGEKMGGSHHAITAGVTLTYELPNTKLELETPIMIVNFDNKIYQNVKEERIEPDLVFSSNEMYEQFLNEKDLEIESVLNLIRNK